MPKRKPSKATPPFPLSTGPLQPGEWVEIAGLSGIGQLLEIDLKRAQARVQTTSAVLTVKPEKLTRAAPPLHARAAAKVNFATSSTIRYEIDLHGMRAEEAVAAADQALDQAVVSHLDSLRIIHGHGTGTLRKAIRELLARHPHVADYRFGDPHEGGLACTVALLKKIR